MERLHRDLGGPRRLVSRKELSPCSPTEEVSRLKPGVLRVRIPLGVDVTIGPIDELA